MIDKEEVDESRLAKALELLDKHDEDGNRAAWFIVLTKLFALGWHKDDRVRAVVRRRTPEWFDREYAEVVGLTAEAMRLFPDSKLVDVVFL